MEKKNENVYSREILLDILYAYKRQIERNKDYPTVLISDLEMSINYVLNKNNYRKEVKV